MPAAVFLATLAAGCGVHGHEATTAASRVLARSPGEPTGAVSPARAGAPAAGAPTSRSAGSASPAAAESPPPGGTPTGGRAGGRSPLPVPGTYTYDVSGTATSPLGRRDLGGTSELSVGPARSGRQRSIDKAPNGASDQTVLARPGGIDLVDLHISQQGFDEDFRPASPVLLFPATPRQGASWSWRIVSTDGKYTMRTTISVANPADSATVSGRRLSTVALTSHTVITGSRMHMTIDQRDEVARGLPVVSEHAVVDGTAYGATFHADSTRHLRSTAPR